MDTTFTNEVLIDNDEITVRRYSRFYLDLRGSIENKTWMVMKILLNNILQFTIILTP